MTTKYSLWALLACFLFLTSCDEFPFFGHSEDETPENETPDNAVDMGLSVMWAANNLGASASSAVGDYFAWGETTPKNLENPQTYIFGDFTTSEYSKYNSVDKKKYLDPEDDAARQQWGSYWRMPTPAEWIELFENCIVEKGPAQDIPEGDETWAMEGFWFTSKINGNRIFLPAGGFFDYRSMQAPELNWGTYYWSNMLSYLGENENNTNLATLYSLSVRYEGDEELSQMLSSAKVPFTRDIACNIRAVYDTIQSKDYPFIYTLHYDANGGSGSVYDMSHSKGESLKVAANTFLREGYYFYEWNTQADGSGSSYTLDQTFALTQDTVLYAQWREVPEDIIARTQGFENGYEWADLGLSVKWAVCNLGATEPQDFGSYFAWGETSPKSEFEPDNYVPLAQDAASVNMGGNWRMPTQAEVMEWLRYCTCVWTSQQGVPGCLVQSQLNGRSLFIPASGFKMSAGWDSALNYQACFWTSTAFNDAEYSNIHFRFSFSPYGFMGSYLMDNDYNGLPIRAVCP